jgi:hypothetical protein
MAAIDSASRLPRTSGTVLDTVQVNGIVSVSWFASATVAATWVDGMPVATGTPVTRPPAVQDRPAGSPVVVQV